METKSKSFPASLNKRHKNIEQKVGNEHMQLSLHQLVGI